MDLNWKKDSAEPLQDQRTVTATGTEIFLGAWAQIPRPPERFSELWYNSHPSPCSLPRLQYVWGTVENFLVGRKREGWVIQHWPLTLQGGNWSQPMCPGLRHTPARRMLNLPGAPFFQVISKTPGEKCQGTPRFFSHFIWFNLAWVLWTWWLTKAPKGWSRGSGEQPHLGEAQTASLAAVTTRNVMKSRFQAGRPALGLKFWVPLYWTSANSHN